MSKVFTPVSEAHKKSVGADISDIARFLQENLGQRLVAHMAGTASPKLVGQWAKGEHAPRSDSEASLRAAYQVFKLLETADTVHVVRAWFIGMNPQLDGESPADIIRKRRFRDVWMAAKAFVAGG